MTEKTCGNCNHLKENENTRPCKECYKFSNWQTLPLPQPDLMCKYAKVTCINQGNCNTCPNEEIIDKACKDSLDILLQKPLPKPEEKKEVCVWRLKDNSEIPNGRNNTFHIWYGTGCDNYYQYPHEKALRFVFCPYCGRKIMVNE
jgi:hypothetical protein